MSASAYVLMQVEGGKAATVATAARDIPEVIVADNVTGPYDLVVQVEAPTIDELVRMVVGRLQLIDGVIRTVTCDVVHL